ncbi:MAG: hypothetical protein N2234_08125, partial [Planctomycetota bacterium]|nr:hypothetical protein [Planctomycetota bacterium]
MKKSASSKISPRKERFEADFLVSDSLKEAITSITTTLFEKPVEIKEQQVTLAQFMPSQMRKETILKHIKDMLLLPSLFSSSLFPHTESKSQSKLTPLAESVPSAVTLLNRLYETPQYRRFYKEILLRRNRILDSLSARRFRMRILSPVVLNLTSPLDSPMPPLDPFYGFPRIPAASIRGSLKEYLSVNPKSDAEKLLSSARFFDAVPADEQSLRISYDFTSCHS